MPNQTILFCPVNGVNGRGDPKPVRLDHIAPDLAMVHLDQHKIKWSDLDKQDATPLGEGKGSVVYLHEWLNHPILVLMQVDTLLSIEARTWVSPLRSRSLNRQKWDHSLSPEQIKNPKQNDSPMKNSGMKYGS